MENWLSRRDFGNVIAMKSPPETTNTKSLLWQMEAYWSALPRTGPVPRRSDVDPRGVEAVLSHALILERVAPGVARIRLAGQHLTELVGMEPRGMPLSALFMASARQDLSDALAGLFDRPAIVRAEISGEPRRFGRPLSGRLLLLPLCLDNGEVSRAVGAIATDTSGPVDPQKLSLKNLSAQPLTASAYAPVEHDHGIFAEAPKPLAGHPPRLRIVHSSD